MIIRRRRFVFMSELMQYLPPLSEGTERRKKKHNNNKREFVETSVHLMRAWSCICICACVFNFYSFSVNAFNDTNTHAYHIQTVDSFVLKSFFLLEEKS